jgi:hypothetical protein
VASPTRQGVAARARQEVVAGAKWLPAQATGMVWPRGPLGLEGLQVPQVRPFKQPITRLAGKPGATPGVPTAGLSTLGRLSTETGCSRVLACRRENFFGGVQDGLW